MCNPCPYVQFYLDRLKQLQSAFQDQGLAIAQLLAGQPIETSLTRAIGCAVKWR
jgi:hypothetical protein